IAIIDNEFVLSQSSAIKSVQAQRDKWVQTYQSELDPQGKALVETKQKLDKEIQELQQQAEDAKQKQDKDRFMQIQTTAQEKVRAFEQSAGEFDRKRAQHR